MLKNRLLFILSLVFVIALTGASITAIVFASEEEWDVGSFNEKYSYGEEFVVPSATYCGVKATSTIVFPDGSATKETNVVLDQGGLYTVSYTARYNGKNYVQKQEFTVVDDILRTGKNSYFEYGKPENASEEGEGLIINLASGESVEFTNVFDLSNSTSRDTIISFYISPKTKGARDFGQIYITFTDFLNPDNYMKFEMHRSGEIGGELFSYSKAKGNGQSAFVGTEEYKGKIHVNNEYGCSMCQSFSGEYKGLRADLNKRGDVYDANPVDLRYDKESNTLFSYAIYDNHNYTVVDFDDSKYFSKFWDGFESGRVKITITADDYSSTHATFVVTKLMGVDIEDECKNGYVDTVAPVITVEKEYETMPDALMGYSYGVPSATAFDECDGYVEVTNSVFYASGLSNQNGIYVPVENGRFNVTRIGLYNIIYTAKDKYGNTAEEQLTVRSLKEGQSVNVDLSETPITDWHTGEKVVFASIGVSGGMGNVDVVVTATCNGETLATDNDSFRPMKAGRYDIVYTATDYVGQKGSVSYTVNVTDSSYPVIIDEPVLPEFLFAYTDNRLDELNAYEFSGSNVKKVKTDIAFIDDNGVHSAADGVVNPTVSENGKKITINYSYNNHIIASYKVPVIISVLDEKMKMINYFVTENATAEYVSGSEGVLLTGKGGNGGAKYANKLLAQNLTADIAAVSDKIDFDSLVFALNDAVDPEKKIELTIVKDGKASKVYCCGKKYDCKYNFTEGKDLSITYADGAFSVLSSGKRLFAEVTKTALGEAFNGFTSDYVYVYVGFNGAANNNSAVIIRNINGQAFTASYSDKVGPNVNTKGDIVSRVRIKDTVVIPVVMTSDVLDPNSSATLSVTYNGNYITAEDGTVLNNVKADREYRFRANKYGNYQIDIEAKDNYSELTNKQKTTRVSKIVSVVDMVAPTITFKHKFNQNVKLGEFIVIPDFSVSDNLSEKNKIIVRKYVYTSGGVVVSIDSDVNGFKPSQAGEYEVRIIAEDEAGNTTFFSVKIQVA